MKKILVLGMIIALLQGVTVFSLDNITIDEISVDEKDMQYINEGFQNFQEIFIENPNDFFSLNSKSMRAEQDEVMIITPLKGEVIAINYTREDPIYLFVSNQDLKEQTVANSYETLTETNQLVTFHNINGKIQVASISEDKNNFLTLSIDSKKVYDTAINNDLDLSNVEYYNSSLFGVSLVSFNEEKFMIFFNNHKFKVPNHMLKEIYTKTEAKNLLEPLITKNMGFFTEYDGTSEILYGGVDLDVYNDNVSYLLTIGIQSLIITVMFFLFYNKLKKI